MKWELHLRLLSDATFGRGEGVAGLIDSEIEHDPETGLPFLRGRTLKGMLVEECANLLHSLKLQDCPALGDFQEMAQILFGSGGSGLSDGGFLHVGPALLPVNLRNSVRALIKRGEKSNRPPRLTPEAALDSLTTIRRQTAMDEETASPEKGSLRAMRVLIREVTLISALTYGGMIPDNSDPTAHTERNDAFHKGEADPRPLLAACALSLRRAGTGRNRGRGRLTAQLFEKGSEITRPAFDAFRKRVENSESERIFNEEAVNL